MASYKLGFHERVMPILKRCSAFYRGRYPERMSGPTLRLRCTLPRELQTTPLLLCIDLQKDMDFAIAWYCIFCIQQIHLCASGVDRFRERLERDVNRMNLMQRETNILIKKKNKIIICMHPGCRKSYGYPHPYRRHGRHNPLPLCRAPSRTYFLYRRKRILIGNRTLTFSHLQISKYKNTHIAAQG